MYDPEPPDFLSFSVEAVRTQESHRAKAALQSAAWNQLGGRANNSHLHEGSPLSTVLPAGLYDSQRYPRGLRPWKIESHWL